MLSKLYQRCVILAVVLCFCSPAQADDFRTHYELAVALYRAQKYEAAIPEFKAAYALDPRPELLFNVAQSCRKSGHPGEAVEFYERYLAADSQLDAETRRKVASYLAESRNTQAALEREVQRRLAAAKAESEPALVSSPVPAPPQEPPAAVSAPVAAEPRSVQPVRTETPARTPLWRRWWLWTAVGGGVVLGGVALGVGLSASGSQPTYMRGTIPDFM